MHMHCSISDDFPEMKLILTEVLLILYYYCSHAYLHTVPGL